MDLEVVLRGVLPPIGAALLFVSLGGSRLVALAVAVGLYVAFGLLRRDWPELPHVLWSAPDGRQWLVWSIAAAALVSLGEHFKVLPRKAGHTAAAVVGVAAVWLVLSKVAANWSPTESLVAIGGGALILLLVLLGTRIVMARAPATMFPAILWTLVLSIDAAVITLSGSALLGQMCGAVAAAVGASIGTALWRRPFALTIADGSWLAVTHVLFVLAAKHLAELPWSAAACLLVAPLAALPVRDGVGASRPKLWAFLATPLVAVPLAGAVWFATQGGSSGY